MPLQEKAAEILNTLFAAMKKLFIRFSKLKAPLRNQFVFSKTVPFICALLLSYACLESTVVFSLMDYITNEVELPLGAILTNLQDGLSCFVVILVSLISEAYTGRFTMVTFCAAASIMGSMLLWISTTSSEYRMAYAAIFLLALSKAGRILLEDFLEYQLDEKVRTRKERKSENEENEKEQDIIRTNIWFYPTWYVGYGLPLIISLIYNDDTYNFYFKFAALLMVGTYPFFFLGCVWYSYEDLSFSFISNLRKICRISKAALRKRNLSYPTSANWYYWKNYKQNHYKNTDGGLIRLLPESPSLFRWLDKAAIVEDQSENQEMKGELCTVKDVREVKSLVPLIYLGFTFFACFLVVASGNTFFIVQANTLGNSKDITLLFLIRDIVSDMSKFICWITSMTVRNLVTNFKIKRKAATIIRIGIGMVFAISCCIKAWQVEAHRLSLIKREDSDIEISMTTRDLFPQFVLLGVTEGLVEDGLKKLFLGHVAESMWNLKESFIQLVMGIGKLLTIPCVLIFSSWFKETLNTSHLDRYFLMLAILNSVFLLIFLYYSFKYAYKEECPKDEESDEEQRSEHDHQAELEKLNETKDDREDSTEIMLVVQSNKGKITPIHSVLFLFIWYFLFIFFGSCYYKKGQCKLLQGLVILDGLHKEIKYAYVKRSSL